MWYKTEFDINSFEFWSGAKTRMDNATEDQINRVEERLEECFSGDMPTDGQINDFVWFECDDIFFEDEEENDEENIA